MQTPQQVEFELAADLAERRDPQVLPDRQAIEELIDLIALGEPELADVGDAHPGDIAPFEHDPARSRGNLAGQHLEESALACPVRPDDAAHFAVIDDEVDVAVGHQSAIALGQACRLQNRSRRLVGKMTTRGNDFGGGAPRLAMRKVRSSCRRAPSYPRGPPPKDRGRRKPRQFRASGSRRARRTRCRAPASRSRRDATCSGRSR